MILTGAKKAQDQDTVGFWPVEDAIAAIGTATDTVALIARHQRIALGQIGKLLIAVGDKSITWVFTATNCMQHQTFRKIDRHIFHTVHCYISTAFQHGGFQLFHKQAFAANFS